MGTKVNSVRFTNKLKNHPVCLTSEGGISVEMEKTLNSMPGQNTPVKAQTVLEISSANPVADKLKSLFGSDKDLLKDYSKLLYDEACLIGGRSIDDPAEHTRIICELMIK